ncbi:glycosyltransferase [Fumia xinanensis]|uniref:Glycosyltransferase n=1 Tax=Fumia xinanensis TaxID=2763659 RepID=A0A926E2G9_9FIRM|nr:glycosyltransferase [Fumia xinanensis]MBC8560076.1 glycosyltransferase [Fumia xinanensis]
MNILIIVDDFSGGAGNVAQLLAIELSKKHKVSLALTNRHSKSRYNLSEISVYDENLNITGKNKIAGLLSAIKRLRERLQTVGAEFVISFLDNNNTMACLMLRKTNIPIIVSERSNPLVIYPKFPWNYLRRIAYKRADVVSVQFDIFRDFDGGRYEKKCMVTHNVIEQPSVFKTEWEKPTVSFVSMGRNADVKRFDLMIKIFGKLLKKCSNVELHIFGAGIDNDTLRAQVDAVGGKDSIHLHEAISNVHEELVQHDVYLMTSEQEGFPNALSEALAVGLPAVVFKCHQGIGDLVKSEENGYCIDEGDEKNFINAMKILALDKYKRQTFGQKSISIAKRYDDQSVMQEWEACIKKAILNRSGRD